MSKKAWFKSMLFLLLICALLIGTTFIVGAHGVNKKQCYVKNYNGQKAAKVCVKADFQNVGESVYCHNPSKTITIYQSGIGVQTLVAPYCSPTGWTTGNAGVAGVFRFKRYSTILSERFVYKSCFSSGGGLYCAGGSRDW